MNINPINSSPVRFSGIYVSDNFQNKATKKLAENVSQQVSCDDRIDKLDEKGIDLLFLPAKTLMDKENIKVIFTNIDNRAYKINGTSAIQFRDPDNYKGINVKSNMVDNIVGKILDISDGILNEEFSEMTKKRSPSVENSFPVRDNSFKRPDHAQNLINDFDENTDPIGSEDFENFTSEYGRYLDRLY